MKTNLSGKTFFTGSLPYVEFKKETKSNIFKKETILFGLSATNTEYKKITNGDWPENMETAR